MNQTSMDILILPNSVSEVDDVIRISILFQVRVGNQGQQQLLILSGSLLDSPGQLLLKGVFSCLSLGVLLVSSSLGEHYHPK